MTDPTLDLDPNAELILLEFEEAVRQAPGPDRNAVLEEFCHKHPRLDSDFREIVAMVGMLASAPCWQSQSAAGGTIGDGSPHPERLGPYKVVRPIGEGGMGIVYEALEETLNLRVAVKTLHRRRASRASLLRRFDRERKLLARMHHTNIVPIFATGQDGDLLYFAMQYIPGASLGQIIRTARYHVSDGVLPPATSFEELVKEAHSSAEAERAREKAGEARYEVDRPASSADNATWTSLPLPEACVRSAVRVISSVAEALHHAHEAGIVHRDLKPSNLMIEINGHTWVLDFGLARLKKAAQGQVADLASPALAGSASEISPSPTEPSLTAGFVGTPAYAAPEQYRDPRNADARTEVWSLGVTLFELLTLRRPFASREEIIGPHPAPHPRHHSPRLARDLEAIILKALDKSPEARYQSTKAFAEDLNRWLHHEPVSVRPAAIPRRLWLWSRRRPGAAVAVAVTAVALVALAASGVFLGKSIATAARAETQAAQAVIRVVRAEAHATSAQFDAARRELALHEIRRLQLNQDGRPWFHKAWELVHQLTNRRRADHSFDRILRQEAFGCLFGFDFATPRVFEEFTCRSVAFDARGRLLMGGVSDARSRKPLNAKLWDGVSPLPPDDLGLATFGPVGFRDDGTPIQLGWEESTQQLTLIDLSQHAILHRFQLPGVLNDDPNHDTLPPVGMTRNGTLVGAGVRRTDRTTALVVWDGLTGQRTRVFEGACRVIAFSPDGALVAGGNDQGQIVVRNLATGQPEAELNAGRNRVNALAFGRNPRTGHDGPDLLPARYRWQLAAGDAGAQIHVWDLGPDVAYERAIFRHEVFYEVYSLDFSPDGSLLASTSRGVASLLDPATGRRLLLIQAGSYPFALAFAPDGRRLAVGSELSSEFPTRNRVQILDLIDGRGVRALRGLSAHVEKAWFSSDDSLVAAISQGWEIGVWVRRTGALKLILDAPPGAHADNSALAISPDNRRLAFSSDREARLWDLETGKVLRRWSLPKGLLDAMVFQGDDRLILARAETSDPTVPPYGTDPVLYPRHAAVYDLLGPEPTKAIRVIPDFNIFLKNAVLASNGNALIIDGLAGPDRDRSLRSIAAFDVISGRRLWSHRLRLPREGGANLSLDRTGKFLLALFDWENDGGVWVLIEATSGKILEQLRDQPLSVAGSTVAVTFRQRPGDSVYWVFVRDRADPVLHIDTSIVPLSIIKAFTRDGKSFVGANSNFQSLVIVDLPEVNRLLTGVDLGW